MKKIIVLLIVLTPCLFFLSFQKDVSYPINADTFADSLREIYSKPSSQWPKPEIDPDLINFQELGLLPDSPLKPKMDSLKQLVKLGQILFFDPRLSGSAQISCSSCHTPSLSWADGRVTAEGHDHQQGTRNTPSLLNIWNSKNLFWDGRSTDLEDQAFGPINNEIEMHGDFSEIVPRLSRIKGYTFLFDSAYGDSKITPDRITHALATFERTITSRKSRFDEFLLGKKNALTDEEVRGLHFFRTQARCINCHNGPLFTDDQFHNIGLTYYKRKYEDLGRYKITRKAEDVGKFKTPSLRDVARTAPWMHNGLFDDLGGIVNLYNSGMPMLPVTDEQKADPLFPKTDVHIKKLNLTSDQKKDIVAFLGSISTIPLRIRNPELPK
ncbi:MAG: cytochrome-c peroxidase [Bacteroidetes bacterium]|nr:cytochrome-c peroxidase [Bacteroidota bacterium]